MITNCYACGQRVSPETQIARLAEEEEETALIARTTQHLDDLIVSLNATRVKLLQRLNELRASTSVLPPELLSTVFHYASPPTDFAAFEFPEEYEDGAPESHPQMALSAVSWYWRSVILTTPQLWANVTINVTHKNAQRRAQLIQLYLANVGNMTMSLALHIFPCRITKSHLDPVFSSILREAQKFKLLSLCPLPKSWIPLLSGPFTQLQDLRWKWAWNDEHPHADPPDPEITLTSSFPRLCRLYLRGSPIHLPSQPPCQSLTILRFFDVPLRISVQMLILCPNLIEYACHGSPIPSDETIPQPSEPMTFSHMKVFYSPCSTAAVFSSILHKFKFPALEALGLELGIADGLEALVSFIACLPTTWPILEISGLDYSTEILERIFQSLPPQVRSLHLPNIHRWNLGTLLDVLNGSDSNGNPYIVGLQTIYIDSSSYNLDSLGGIDHSPSNPRLFLAMVSARKDHLIDGQFCLEIKWDNVMYWDKVRERLEQMTLDGFKLTISMAGKSIHPPPGI